MFCLDIARFSKYRDLDDSTHFILNVFIVQISELIKNTIINYKPTPFSTFDTSIYFQPYVETSAERT